MSDAVLYEKRDRCVLLTLNRPKVRNALSSQEVINGIVDGLERAQHDTQARVIIITGAGTSFSSGGDYRKLQANSALASTSPWQLVDQYRYNIQRIPKAFAALDLPIIAAVNGPAIGAGCDLACMCDVRIAGQSARFAESFVSLGIVAGDGGAWFLPRIVGRSKAYEMALTGESMPASEALSCGLVSKVTDDENLIPMCMELAEKIARNPPFAVRMTKLLIKESEHSQLGSALNLSAALQALAHTTSDHRTALQEMEKRLNKTSSISKNGTAGVN